MLSLPILDAGVLAKEEKPPLSLFSGKMSEYNTQYIPSTEEETWLLSLDRNASPQHHCKITLS